MDTTTLEAITALVDARLGLAFTLFGAASLAAFGWVRRRGTPHWEADRQRSALFYGYLGEVLASKEDLRACGAQPYTMRRLVEHLRAGRPNHVLMPYANRLYLLADWFRQLWAESLGKKHSLSGKDVFCGLTPVKALGVTVRTVTSSGIMSATVPLTKLHAVGLARETGLNRRTSMFGWLSKMASMRSLR